MISITDTNNPNAWRFLVVQNLNRGFTSHLTLYSTIFGILVTPQEECAHDNNITYNRQGIMGMFLLPKDYYYHIPNNNMLS